MKAKFCPFCGSRSLLNQGGSDEVDQFQCGILQCHVFFNLEVLIDERDEEDE